MTKKTISLIHFNDVHGNALPDTTLRNNNTNISTHSNPTTTTITKTTTTTQYHVEPFTKEPVGGAARFITALQDHIETKRNENLHQYEPIVLFSGDLFNPSIESSITQGKHMIPVVNKCRVKAACVGNHDLDFSVPVLEELTAKTNFPWLISNCFDTATGAPLANGKEFVILEEYGLKIGIIGIIEKEWLETCPSLPPTVDYRDFVQTATDLTQKLKSAPYSCDLVIALTHMRVPNDEKLVRQCTDYNNSKESGDCPHKIDIILGGHDHFFYVFPENLEKDDVTWEGDVRCVKSGCDFKDIGFIDLDVDKVDGVTRVTNVKVTRKRITSDIVEDPDILAVLEETSELIANTLGIPVAKTPVQLEARSVIVRKYESNLGNFASDLLRFAYDTQVGFLCGGAIRGDCVYGPGEISVRDIMDLFPFEDSCIVLKLKGSDLLEALENGVSAVPNKTEGRFPQVSGIKFKYDSRLPPMKRIVSAHLVSPNSFTETPLDPEAYYTVATRHYLAQGNDGFKAFTRGEYLVDAEDGVLLSCIFRRYFLGAKYVGVMKKQRVESPAPNTPRSPTPSLPYAKVDSPMKKVNGDAREETPTPTSPNVLRNAVVKVMKLTGKLASEAFTNAHEAAVPGSPNNANTNNKKRKSVIMEEYLPVISPVIEGRIIDVVNPTAAFTASQLVN